MTQVSVVVNGRSWTVACDEGDEEHVVELARYVDKRVKDLAASIGQVGDARLLLMAALTIADELSEMLAKIDDLEDEVKKLDSGRNALTERAQKAESAAAEVLEVAARRLEHIAGRLEAS